MQTLNFTEPKDTG